MNKRCPGVEHRVTTGKYEEGLTNAAKTPGGFEAVLEATPNGFLIRKLSFRGKSFVKLPRTSLIPDPVLLSASVHHG
jgi:hypothetical protein